MALAALAGALALALGRDLGSGAVSAAMAGLVLAVTTLGFPLLEPVKSARVFSRAAALRAGAQPMAYYGEDLQAAYPFYAERSMHYMETSAQLSEYVDFLPGSLVLLRERDFRRLPVDLQGRLETVLAWDRSLETLLPPWVLKNVSGKDDVLAVRMRP